MLKSSIRKGSKSYKRRYSGSVHHINVHQRESKDVRLISAIIDMYHEPQLILVNAPKFVTNLTP